MKWIGTQTIYDHVRLNKGITLDSVSITTIQSSGESFADNDTSLMTSAAIDDRINTAVTAEDLDLTADSGTAAVDLNSQALAVTGGTGITTSATGQAVTLNVDAVQTGITSLGTLTGLILDGNKDVTPGDGAMIHVDQCDITDSNTSASGTAAKYTHVNIETPRLFADNIDVTTTNAATLYVENAPTAGTNQTFDNAYALWVDDGLVKFDGALTVGGTITGNVTGNVTGNTSGSSGSCTGQAATVATIAGLAPNTATTQATQPNITTLAGLTTIGATGVDTVINSDTFNFYDDVDNGNPIFSIGSSATNRLMIQAVYESGGKLLDYMQFKTYTASSTAHAGRFLFSVDDVGVLTVTDGGIQGLDSVNLNASGTLAIDGTSFLSDSSGGTFTLQNIDALDATTEATIESAIDTLSNLTTTGTIGTGVWQGTAIASAYLDADTAHYSATRQVTHHMITDDIDSDVIYISLGEIDSEGTSATGKHLPLIAPTAGKLLKIFLRTSVNYSSETFTWKLYTRNVSASTGGSPSEIGAQSGAGPTNKTMVTYDFTTGLDSGTNAIAAGDKVQISIEAGDGATANGNYFITCLWEWDLS
tara:strand:- start:785 stop:2557 length:1773 start_codon:yes stop_codon:yes gene_type:complete